MKVKITSTALFLAILPLAQAQTFTLVNVDTNANAGKYSSLAIVNGNPAISYVNTTSGDLLYVRATDSSGSAWGTPVTVDSGGNGGENTSLVVVNGNPAICYRDSSLADVKYVRATDANGTSPWGLPVTVVSTGTVGLYSSMQVVNGNPAIAYYDSTSGDFVKFVRASDVNGASWGSPATIATSGGFHLSMNILPDGSPGVSYRSTSDTLKFVRAADASLTSWYSPSNVDTTASAGYYTSWQNVNGQPAIAYINFNLASGFLRYVRSGDPNGLSWIGQSGVISSNVVNANFGAYTSLQIISNKPAIAYQDGSSFAVKYVSSTNINGIGTWTAVNVDSAGSLGGYCSLQALAAGTPAISYQYQGGGLKFAYVPPPAAPEIAVEQPSGTNIPDTGSKDFGSVALSNSTSLTFTIKNTGTTNLTGLTVTKDGVNSNDFAVTVAPGAPVAAGSSTNFTVQFAPGGTGARTAAIHIANNDSDENPFDITLTGTGTAPEIAVEQPAGSSITDGGTKDFGSVVVGGDNSLTVTIKNTGTANLTGLTITKDGANTNDFTVTVSPTAPVAPSGSTTFTVRFAPGGTGSRTAALHIANNDSDENPFDINVTGTGTSTGAQSWSASSGGGNGASNGVADSLRIRLNGANIEFSADGGATWTASAPLSTMTNLTLTGSSDDDTFVIDLSSGNPIPSGGIIVNGGAQTSTGDQMVLTGGATTTITHSFLNANDGSVTLAGATAGTITYTGLEPITDNLGATNRVFTFGGGAETITLADAAGAAMTIDSTLSESVTFANPSASLTINAGTGADTITITSVDANGPFNAALTINGGAATDTVNLNGDITLAAGKDLVVSAETVTVGPNVDLTTSGAGTLTFSADALIIDATASLTATTVSVTPNTVTTAINLGGADAAGTLGLTDAELDCINANTINLGDATGADITVSAPISRATATVLNLNSGGTIHLNAGPLNSGGGNVTLHPVISVSPAATGTDVSMGTNGTLAFGPGDNLAISISGATVDSQYQQLNVAGKVDLSGVELTLLGSYAPASGNIFIIVNNDGSDSITGNFTGLPEGATLLFNGSTLRITYVGGDGNDVALLANNIPVLPPQNDRTIDELTTLVVTNTATDVESNTLTYALTGPAGAQIDTNGVITWTPTEVQGPDTKILTTIVTDSGGLSATNTFSVTVDEVNLPPSLNTLTNYTVNPGHTISFAATATDPDVPTNTLSFSLVNPPDGASIGSGSGVFNWRPTVAQRNSTNVIYVRVQDDGSPNLRNTNFFTAIVNPLAPVILTPIAHTNGQFTLGVSGTPGPDYVFLVSTNLTNWTRVATNLSPATPFQFNDTASFGLRFYRVRLEP